MEVSGWITTPAGMVTDEPPRMREHFRVIGAVQSQSISSPCFVAIEFMLVVNRLFVPSVVGKSTTICQRSPDYPLEGRGTVSVVFSRISNSVNSEVVVIMFVR